jgi:uncharacterized protein with PIN domain
MQYPKHNFKRKMLHRDYNQNYHLIRTSYSDKDVRITIDRCDLCNDQLPQTEGVNLETRMKIIDEIDNSFESEYDKSTYEQGPKLLLCEYCQKEYLLPSYQRLKSSANTLNMREVNSL